MSHQQTQLLFASTMPCCPGCSYPIDSSEILCRGCLREDFAMRWPRCQTCYRYDACGESGYQICVYCYAQHLNFLHRAAIPIQSLMRMALAQKLLQKHKAARSIQALWRGYRTRLLLVLQARCGACCQEPATMPNDFDDRGCLCADCFWDLNKERRYRRKFEY
jgi:hypothetical protein